MFKYLIQDLKWALGYLPYGILAAAVLFVFFSARNVSRMKQGQETRPIMSSVAFCTYLLIIFCLTLLSREQGSTTKIDLEIGSTLRINARNNAYVVENILLFIPYGFCLAWRFGSRKRWSINIFTGLLTTLAVEYTQLLTGRGVFQIDDILTNALGCAFGLICYGVYEAVTGHGKVSEVT